MLDLLSPDRVVAVMHGSLRLEPTNGLDHRAETGGIARRCNRSLIAVFSGGPPGTNRHHSAQPGPELRGRRRWQPALAVWLSVGRTGRAANFSDLRV